MGTRKTRHLYSFRARFRNRRLRRLGRPPTPSARRCSAPRATRRRRRRSLPPDVTPLEDERRATGTEKRGASAPRSTATGRARRRRRRRPRAYKNEKRFFGGARRRVSLRPSGAGAGRACMLQTARPASVMRLMRLRLRTMTWRRYIPREDRKRCGRRGGARPCARGSHTHARRRDLLAARRDRASRRPRRRLLPGRVRVPKHATLSRWFRDRIRSSVSARHSRSTRSGRPGGAPGARTRRRTRRASPEPERCRRRAARRKRLLRVILST